MLVADDGDTEANTSLPSSSSIDVFLLAAGVGRVHVFATWGFFKIVELLWVDTLLFPVVITFLPVYGFP